MKKKNNIKKNLDDVSVDEILRIIDNKIQDIESGESKISITKTKIDGVDIKNIIKKIDDKRKQLEKLENNNDL